MADEFVPKVVNALAGGKVYNLNEKVQDKWEFQEAHYYSEAATEKRTEDFCETLAKLMGIQNFQELFKGQDPDEEVPPSDPTPPTPPTDMDRWNAI